MRNDYYLETPVGEMLSYYMDQSQAVRASHSVFNIPDFKQIRSLFNYGSIFGIKKEMA